MKQSPDIILSIRLSDNSIYSEIRIPTDTSEKDRNSLVAAWVKLIDAGVKMAKEMK